MPGDATPSDLWPADNPAVIAHLGQLQGIIGRLAQNSASCKTWCLTLVAAFLTFASATHNPNVIAFGLVPVVVLGSLDCLYLANERAFRAVYAEVVERVRTRSYHIATAYGMTTTVTPAQVLGAGRSWSVWPVYGGLALAYVVARWLGVLDRI